MPKNVLLSNEVAEEIKNYIIRNEFKTGDKLPNETELSNMLDVSRITIREAVKILSAMGIVEIHRGVGTFVCHKPGLSSDPLGLTFMESTHLFEDIYQVRSIIEPVSAALAAVNATEEDIAEILKILEEYEQIYHDYIDNKITLEIASRKYIANEISFHTQLSLCSKNEVLARVIYILSEAYMKRYWSEDFIPPDLGHHATHMRIIEPIRNHDPEQARKAMIEHLEFGKKYNQLHPGK